MKKSPITILDHFPGKIRITPADTGSDVDETCSVSTKTTWSLHRKLQRHYRVNLTVHFGKIKKGDLPERYRGEVEMIGFFQIHEDYPEKHLEEIICITAVSILYGAARELICNLTARQPLGCLSIPSVSFIDTIKKQKPKKSTKLMS